MFRLIQHHSSRSLRSLLPRHSPALVPASGLPIQQRWYQKAKYPQSPGDPNIPGKIPDAEDIAVGNEWEEIQAAKEGWVRFETGPLTGPFGTLKDPVIIFSGFKSRIVGCVGGGGYPHRLLWFELKRGKKHVCKECGQIFKLWPGTDAVVQGQQKSSFGKFEAYVHELSNTVDDVDETVKRLDPAYVSQKIGRPLTTDEDNKLRQWRGRALRDPKFKDLLP